MHHQGIVRHSSSEQILPFSRWAPKKKTWYQRSLRWNLSASILKQLLHLTPLQQRQPLPPVLTIRMADALPRVTSVNHLLDTDVTCDARRQVKTSLTWLLRDTNRTLLTGRNGRRKWINLFTSRSILQHYVCTHCTRTHTHSPYNTQHTQTAHTRIHPPARPSANRQS